MHYEAYAPGTTSSQAPLTHEGEEAGIVIEGRSN